MIPYVTRFDGRLKAQAGDKDAQPSRYTVVTVPAHWTEMKAIQGPWEAGRAFSQPGPTVITWGLSPYLERRFREFLGEVPTLLDVEEGKITTTGPIAEWLVEIQGWDQTLRVGRMIDSRAAFEDEIREQIDPEIVVVPHDRHFSLKTRSREAAMMLAVRYGEYMTGTDARASIEEINRS